MTIKKQNDSLLRLLNLEAIGFIEIFRNKEDVGNRFIKYYNDAHAYLEFRIFQNKFFAFAGWIEFPKVESILEESLIKLGFDTHTNRRTFSTYPLMREKSYEPILKKHSDAQEVELSTEENIQHVSVMLLDVIRNLYFPIF